MRKGYEPVRDIYGGLCKGALQTRQEMCDDVGKNALGPALMANAKSGKTGAVGHAQSLLDKYFELLDEKSKYQNLGQRKPTCRSTIRRGRSQIGAVGDGGTGSHPESVSGILSGQMQGSSANCLHVVAPQIPRVYYRG